jgi:hypothetical protein
MARSLGRIVVSLIATAIRSAAPGKFVLAGEKVWNRRRAPFSVGEHDAD